MEYLLVFTITFLAFICFMAVIMSCRRRVSRTRHGLTGMCHSSGGSMCGSCQTELGGSTCGKDS